MTDESHAGKAGQGSEPCPQATVMSGMVFEAAQAFLLLLLSS